MKPQLPARTRLNGQRGTLQAIRHDAKQPTPTDDDKAPPAKPQSRQQAKQQLRRYRHQ